MTTATIPKPADRDEWLAARRPWFNASAAGVLYDCHPFLTAADVVADKLDPAPPVDASNEAMDRGNRLEPVLLQWWGDQHGIDVVTPAEMFSGGRILATLDGVPVGESDEWCEVKTTAQVWHEPPEHVYWQVVAQAAASGRSTCHVVWIDAEMRFKSTVVTPSAEHVADVLERAESFMAFIDLGMAPEGVALTAAHVARMYPAPLAGQYVDLDLGDYEAVCRWEESRQSRIAAEKAEAAAKDTVATILMDAEGARFDGVPVLHWRANKPTARTDWKGAALSLAAELGVTEPELVEAHTITTPGARVLRATKHLGAF